MKLVAASAAVAEEDQRSELVLAWAKRTWPEAGVEAVAAEAEAVPQPWAPKVRPLLVELPLSAAQG